jgi:hypothetical protein
MSKLPPPPPFDGKDEDDLDDADDDVDDYVESQDLLAPSQEEDSQLSYSPSQHAQPFDAPPRRDFLSSPVEASRQFSELIHPPHDSSVQNSPLADRAIAYGDDDSDVSVCHRRLLDDDRDGGNDEDEDDDDEDDDDEDDDDGNGGVGDDDDGDGHDASDCDNNDREEFDYADNFDDDVEDDHDNEYDSEGTVVPGTQLLPRGAFLTPYLRMSYSQRLPRQPPYARND